MGGGGGRSAKAGKEVTHSVLLLRSSPAAVTCSLITVDKSLADNTSCQRSAVLYLLNKMKETLMLLVFCTLNVAR